MKKLIAILLTLVMVLSVAACGGKTEAPVATAENQKPAISGVQDASVEAGQVFDALAGVTASDAEDGDLTTMITSRAARPPRRPPVPMSWCTPSPTRPAPPRKPMPR